MRFTKNSLSITLYICLITTAGTMLSACSDGESETEIPLSQIPSNIIDIVQGTLPGIVLTEAEKEIHDKKVIYELEGKMINGLEYEINIAKDGTIIKIELED